MPIFPDLRLGLIKVLLISIGYGLRSSFFSSGLDSAKATFNTFSGHPLEPFQHPVILLAIIVLPLRKAVVEGYV